MADENIQIGVDLEIKEAQKSSDALVKIIESATKQISKALNSVNVNSLQKVSTSLENVMAGTNVKENFSKEISSGVDASTKSMKDLEKVVKQSSDSIQKDTLLESQVMTFASKQGVKANEDLANAYKLGIAQKKTELKFNKDIAAKVQQQFINLSKANNGVLDSVSLWKLAEGQVTKLENRLGKLPTSIKENEQVISAVTNAYKNLGLDSVAAQKGISEAIKSTTNDQKGYLDFINKSIKSTKDIGKGLNQALVVNLNPSDITKLFSSAIKTTTAQFDKEIKVMKQTLVSSLSEGSNAIGNVLNQLQQKTPGAINLDSIFAGIKSTYQEVLATNKAVQARLADDPLLIKAKMDMSQINEEIRTLNNLKNIQIKVNAPVQQIDATNNKLEETKIKLIAANNLFKELSQTRKAEIILEVFKGDIDKTFDDINAKAKAALNVGDIAGAKKALSTMQQLGAASSETGIELQQTINKVKSMSSAFTQMGTVAKANVQKINNEVKKIVPSPFAGWALSLMLFGMQLKQVLSRIWQQSQKTFNEVMHSVEGTVTGFDMLTGSVSYLQFAIGAALDPIAQVLAPIIDNVAQWVSENEGVARSAFIIAGAFALVFIGIGQWALMTNAIIDFGKELSKLAPLLAKINFGSIWQTIKGLAAEIWLAAKATWNWAASALAAAAPWLILIGIVAMIIALAISLKATWREVIGGWIVKIQLVGTWFEGLWLTIKQGWETIVFLFKKGMIKIKEFFSPILNWLGETFASTLNLIIDGLNATLHGFQKLNMFTDITDFGKVTYTPIDSATIAADLATIEQLYNDSSNAIIKDRQDLLDKQIKLINEGIDIANTGEDNFKSAWSNIFKSLKDGFNSWKNELAPTVDASQLISPITQQETQTNVSIEPPVTYNYVYLDGKEIANNVSSRILNEVNIVRN